MHEDDPRCTGLHRNSAAATARHSRRDGIRGEASSPRFFSSHAAYAGVAHPGGGPRFYSNAVFPKSEIWLCERSGETVGFIAFRSGWVDHLYVHPEHQEIGIGSALLALAQCSQRSLRLWTFQCNRSARRFYERHGFRIERETDGANNEERQPDILYRWA